MKEPFCLNSRRFLYEFDAYGLPNTCPQKGYQGNTWCIAEDCGYYQEREMSRSARERFEAFKGFGAERMTEIEELGRE